MFQVLCSRIRKAVYGVLAVSELPDDLVNWCSGTAFMIAPGFLVTAAHLVHQNREFSQPVHQKFSVVCATDLGLIPEVCRLVDQDPLKDLALLQIVDPRHTACVTLNPSVVPLGQPCGSLGFPFSVPQMTPIGFRLHLVERFQGAHVSAYYRSSPMSSEPCHTYETDALMYQGSSGCPGFLEDGSVFGMHVASVVAPGTKDLLGERLALSRWVPSPDILDWAQKTPSFRGLPVSVGG